VEEQKANAAQARYRIRCVLVFLHLDCVLTTNARLKSTTTPTSPQDEQLHPAIVISTSTHSPDPLPIATKGDSPPRAPRSLLDATPNRPSPKRRKHIARYVFSQFCAIFLTTDYFLFVSTRSFHSSTPKARPLRRPSHEVATQIRPKQTSR
jgi:hypothetical protein